MESVWTKQIEDMQRQYEARMERAEIEIMRAKIQTRLQNRTTIAKQALVFAMEQLMSLQPSATPSMVFDQMRVEPDQRDELLQLYGERHALPSTPVPVFRRGISMRGTLAQ